MALDSFIKPPLGYMAYTVRNHLYFDPSYLYLEILEVVYQMGDRAKRIISQSYIEKAIEAEKEGRFAVYNLLASLENEIPYNIDDTISFTGKVKNCNIGQILAVAIPVDVRRYARIDDGVYLYCQLMNKKYKAISYRAYINVDIVKDKVL